MDDRNCSYKLITKKYISKGTTKNCTKVYHIIFSLHISTYVESNKIRLLILYSFYDLLCLFKDPVKIKKKEKRKKCCHLSLKPLREVMCPVSGVQGVQSNDFVVQRKKWILLKIEGGKRNFFREKWSNLPRAARPGRQPSLVYPAHLACSETD